MTSQYDRYGDYIVDRRQSLGAGTYGAVWRGFRIIHGRQGQEDYLESVAIKQSAYDQKNIQQISTLQILTHPNIVRYIDYKISKDSLFLVMELCEGGTLEDLLMEFDDDEDLTDQVLYYYSQVVSGIKFMYDKNILHRDLKPSNILIKENKIKIADFGTSKLKQDNEMIRTLVGTTLFASPQILELFVGDENSYTEKSDIWSLGLILYLMFHYKKQLDTPMKRLSASLPWRGKSPIDVLNNIKNKPLVFDCEAMPEPIKDIIRRMLTIDVQQRMSFQQFFQIEYFRREHTQKMIKQSKLDLMGQSAVNLSLSNTYNYSEYELTLINECTRQPQFLKRQTVDFQLLKLLQIKDTEQYEEREVTDAIKFYELVQEQAENSNQKGKYNDLLYQLDTQLYQLLFLRRFFIQKLSSANKGIRKSNYHNLKNTIQEIFNLEHQPQNQLELQISRRTKAIVEKHFAFEKRFDTINMFLRGLFEELLNTSNIMEKEKLMMKVMVPNEHFTQEIRIVLKDKRTFLFENRDKLNAVMAKVEIYLVYDLLNCMAFDYCCRLKRQDKRKGHMKYSQFYDIYKEERSKISIRQIINRILDAYNVIKL